MEIVIMVGRSYVIPYDFRSKVIGYYQQNAQTLGQMPDILICRWIPGNSSKRP